jgi:anti-sigma factor RsiW
MMKRDEIETLLPWYAAGTLSRSDADRVEQALASDQELAQCFELIRKELAETIYLNETLGAPSQRAAEKLFAAIDAEDAQSRRSAPSALRPIAPSAGLPLLNPPRPPPEIAPGRARSICSCISRGSIPRPLRAR